MPDADSADLVFFHFPPHMCIFHVPDGCFDAMRRRVARRVHWKRSYCFPPPPTLFLPKKEKKKSNMRQRHGLLFFQNVRAAVVQAPPFARTGVTKNEVTQYYSAEGTHYVPLTIVHRCICKRKQMYPRKLTHHLGRVGQVMTK